MTLSNTKTLPSYNAHRWRRVTADNLQAEHRRGVRTSRRP